MGEVITFTSGKGGVGKTTTTANVGVGLSQLDKKVVLIDTDIGLRNLDVVMGLENRIRYHLVDVLCGRCRIKQALIRDKRFPNLYIIPSACIKEHTRLSKAQMIHLIEELKAEFDYILIDSPAGIDDGFELAIAGADHVVVVTTPQVAAVHDADCVLRIVKKNPALRCSLLVNAYHEQMAKDGNMLRIEDVTGLLETELLGVVYEDAQIIISQNHGEPVYGRKSKAESCYANICARINGEDIPVLGSRQKKNQFRFFFDIKVPSRREA